MKVLVHPDPVVLERSLIERLATARPAGSAAPLLVLVPTELLAGHLRRRLAERHDAWLGVDILTFRGLARRALEAGEAAALTTLPKLQLDGVLAAILRERPENRWSRFARERPGSLRPLVHAFNDLREAGIEPGEFAAAAEGADQGALGELFAAYDDALERLAGRGLGDGAALARAALPGVAAWSTRYRGAWLHGAYELVGVNLQLLRAVDDACGVETLWPVAPGSRVTEYAERYAARHLATRLEPLAPPPPGSSLGERLTWLYDEDRLDPAASPAALDGLHAQGAAHELTAAIRRAMRTVADGVAPEGIAVVSRTLSPYAGALEPLVDSLSLATTLAAPLRREPLVHDLLLLMRVVLDGFPRGATIELLGSPRVRWRRLSEGWQRPSAAAIDRWTRRAGILGGLDEWTRTLPRWAEAEAGGPAEEDEEEGPRRRYAEWRREELEHVACALRELAGRVDAEGRGAWSRHADLIDRWIAGLFHVRDDEIADALRERLDRMRERERLPGGERSVGLREAVDWFERAVDEAERPCAPDDRGGLRVTDAMQMRGLTCDHLHFAGLHGKLFPRLPVADPFLPDSLRARLLERTGKPLTLRADAEDEERLLLALMLGSARQSVSVSWQRADEDGRTLAPSSALREIARVACGLPETGRFVDAATAYPSHPQAFLTAVERHSGLLSSSEEALLVALRAPSPAAAREALQSAHADLEPGLAMLRDTEQFRPRRLRFDARVGKRAALPAVLSVSALEQLGRCPLQFFFERVLGVPRSDEEANPFELSALEMGRRVHGLLERLYRTLLDDEGRLLETDGERLVERAKQGLAAAWDAVMHDVEAARRERLGLLWDSQRDAWFEALAAFLEEDLPRLAETRPERVRLEQAREEELRFDGRRNWRVRGRFDRVVEGRESLRVADYKTRGKLDKKVNVTRMLRAEELQAPLYRLLAGGEAAVDMLGVGTYYTAHAGRSRREQFAGFDDGRRPQRDGFLETMRVLTGLLREGRFPMRPDDYRCGFCSYRSACRQNHPPTIEREEAAADAADLRLLAKKNKSRAVRLADVRLADHPGQG